MNIEKLIADLDLKIDNPENVNIQYLSQNSNDIKPNTLFIAKKGKIHDGNVFALKAVKNGAVAVLTEDDDLKTSCVKLVSKNINADTAVICRRFYKLEKPEFKIIGITGTNGKTTTSYYLKNIFDAKFKTGLIGTINHIINNTKLPAENTTPEPLYLYSLLDKMNKAQVEVVIMEVSSHALELERVSGIKFDAAVFTNLTQDHLDFHGSMENYRNAKKKLFSMLSKNGTAVINIDDKNASYMMDNIKQRKQTLTMRNKEADWQIKINGISMDGSRFDLINDEENITIQLNTSLIGDHNIYNSALSAITAYSLGIDSKTIKNGIKNLNSVEGRFEKIISAKGFYVIIDFAHTPDALERISKTCKRLSKGKVITVFGCGGDRDKQKRPIMGKIASHLSDFVIVTSDNPRTENPEKIINDIVKGINEKNYFIKPNRRKAISRALRIADKDDTVVIAGKGHEKYQIIGLKKYYFDDRKEVEKNI